METASTSVALPASQPSRSGYNFLRWLVRLWAGFQFRNIRLLQSEPLSDPGPVLFFCARPARLLDALILVAALERRVRCLIAKDLILRWLDRRLAAGLGMIPYEPGTQAAEPALDLSCAVLAEGGAVAVFAEPQAAGTAAALRACNLTARIALEAESRQSAELGLAVMPVHFFSPSLRRGEALVHVGASLFPQDYLESPREVSIERISEFAATLDRAASEDTFSLQPGSVQQFLSELEQALREDLEQEWSRRPGWKQTTEGFRLSRRVLEWSGHTNRASPEQLVALKELLAAYREGRRVQELRRLQVEIDPRMRSRWRRIGIWLESVVGAPMAGFGAINHVVAGLLLRATGLLKKAAAPNRAGKLFTSALVLIGCYAAQIAIVGHWLGRSAAGYYAVALPVSGAYLLRYVWLLRRRTRLLWNLAAPVCEARLRRTRAALLEQFEKAQDAYAQTLELAR